jgi:hypothetical protein
LFFVTNKRKAMGQTETKDVPIEDIIENVNNMNLQSDFMTKLIQKLNNFENISEQERNMNIMILNSILTYNNEQQNRIKS